MTNEPSAYERLGASATKSEVHAAIASVDPGLFPGAFCKLAEDVLGGDSAWCAALHADGAGTKTIVAYLRYCESGDPSTFASLAFDAIAMNVDDLACVGAVDRFLLSNTIGRNRFRIPGDALAALIGGFESGVRLLRGLGVAIRSTGGETADLADNVRTLVVDATVATRLPRQKVIDNRRIAPGDFIVGLSSTGQATYEVAPNSGVGANGLTLARHALLSKDYLRRYPESAATEIATDLVYRGPFQLSDAPAELGMTVGAALASPTRTYLPIVRATLAEIGDHVHGLIHNTGGGQTKCLRFGDGISFHKDRLFDAPPIFRLIAEHGGVEWREMYQTFNMGHRFEIIVPPGLASRVIDISKRFGVAAQVVGHCRAAASNAVTLHTPHGSFVYGVADEPVRR